MRKGLDYDNNHVISPLKIPPKNHTQKKKKKGKIS